MSLAVMSPGGFGLIAKSQFFVDWKNPGNEGQLWVALLRDLGGGVVINGGVAEYEDAGKWLKMVVPSIPSVKQLLEYKFPADTENARRCRDWLFAKWQGDINAFFQPAIAAANSARAAGVPDSSVVDVVPKLVEAHEKAAPVVAKLLKDDSAFVVSNLRSCLDRPPPMVMKGPAGPTWSPPVPAKPAQMPASAIAKVVAGSRGASRSLATGSSSWVVPAIGVGVLAAAVWFYRGMQR